MFTIKEFLRTEVKPALGCTEPGAVALAVARAKEELGGPVDAVTVTVSDSIYKNGVDVGIPGTEGLRGNNVAAALSAFCGRSSYGLEVLKDCTGDDIESAKAMLGKNAVKIIPDLDRHGVFIEADVRSGDDAAVCRIEGSHTGISEVTLNGKTIFSAEKNHHPAEQPRKRYLADCPNGFPELVSLVDTMDGEDTDYVMSGVEMNMTIAEYGFDPSRPRAGHRQTLKKPGGGLSTPMTSVSG